MKKPVKVILWVLLIYCIVSSVVIMRHIDWQPQESEYFSMATDVYPATSENISRILMGLPRITNGHRTVEPPYLISVAIRMIIVIGSTILLIRGKKIEKLKK